MGAWYTFLGDSITAGDGATNRSLSYPSRTVALLQTRQEHPAAEVLAGSGWTSGELLSEVMTNPAFYLTKAAAVTVWVGGDNITQSGMGILSGARVQPAMKQALTQYARDLTGLLGTIRRTCRVPIVLCTQYNPFPNTPIAGQAVATLNSATVQMAARFGATVAPVHAWFAGRQAALIQGYRTGRIQDILRSPGAPVHPNNMGHEVIANGLAPLLRSVR